MRWVNKGGLFCLVATHLHDDFLYWLGPIRIFTSSLGDDCHVSGEGASFLTGLGLPMFFIVYEGFPQLGSQMVGGSRPVCE